VQVNKQISEIETSGNDIGFRIQRNLPRFNEVDFIEDRGSEQSKVQN
jgi:hypothetical protein